jgi:hypothetical protein
MRRLKKYIDHFEQSTQRRIYESANLKTMLEIELDDLIDSIGGKKKDIFKAFSLPEKEYRKSGMLDIDRLGGSGEKSPDEFFVNSLASIQMKKSEPKHSSDYETFLNKPCKFMFIYAAEANDSLEDPIYMLSQSWNETIGRWEETTLHKVDGNAKGFLDMLQSKKIELSDGKEKWEYETSNVNDWILSKGTEDDSFKKSLRKEEMQALIDEKDLKVEVI